MLDELKKNYGERSDAMAILNVYSLLDGLHINPRFVKLQQQFGQMPR